MVTAAVRDCASCCCCCVGADIGTNASADDKAVATRNDEEAIAVGDD